VSQYLILSILFLFASILFNKLIIINRKDLEDKNYSSENIKISSVKNWIWVIGLVILSIICFLMWLIE
jgi:hypothetical protein